MRISDWSSDVCSSDLPAFPHLRNLDRVGEIEARLVEQDEAEPAAEDHAERRPDEEVVELLRPDQAGRPFGEPQAIAPDAQQPGDIGKRVPPERDRADRNGDGVEIGEDIRPHDVNQYRGWVALKATN